MPISRKSGFPLHSPEHEDEPHHDYSNEGAGSLLQGFRALCE